MRDEERRRKKDNKFENFTFAYLAFVWGSRTPGTFSYNSITKASFLSVTVSLHFAMVITKLLPYL